MTLLKDHQILGKVVELTGASFSINANTSRQYLLNMDADKTLTSITNLQDHGHIEITVAQDATGGRTFTLPASYVEAGSVDPVPNSNTLIHIRKIGGVNNVYFTRLFSKAQASNGITRTGDDIELGGTLEGDTNLDLDGKNLRFEGSTNFFDVLPNGNVQVRDNGDAFGSRLASQALVTDRSGPYYFYQRGTGVSAGFYFQTAFDNLNDLGIDGDGDILIGGGSTFTTPNSPSGNNARLYVIGGATVLQNTNTDGDEVLVLGTDASSSTTFTQETHNAALKMVINSNIPQYNDNAAATAGGLVANDFYRDNLGFIRQVL